MSHQSFRLERRQFLPAFTCSLALAGCASTGSQQVRHLPNPRQASAGAGTKAYSGPSLGRFAGYTWLGRVTSVAASWTVPRVLSRSETGEASTWIGAQARGRQMDAPFIQVGTNEGRFASADGKHTDEVYWAFWTDTPHHFAPITLFPVGAGDQVTASLTSQRGQWRVELADLTTGASASFSTTEEARADMSLAEWEQEDVGTAERAGPYPRLASIGFRGMRADGMAPNASRLVSQWMSSNIGDYAPSGLGGDSFTLQRVQLGAAGARYLSIALREDQAFRKFMWQMYRWNPATRDAQIIAEEGAFGRVLQATISDLSKFRWPARVQQPMRGLIANSLALWTLTSPDETYPGSQTEWKARWISTERVLAASARSVRTALGLPTGPTG